MYISRALINVWIEWQLEHTCKDLCLTFSHSHTTMVIIIEKACTQEGATGATLQGGGGGGQFLLTVVLHLVVSL